MKNQKNAPSPASVHILTEALSPLLLWYDREKRDLPWRRDKDPYRIWISEIMLQQTRVAAAIPYYNRFMEALPTVEALAAVDDEALLKLWEGLGYYSRARNLKKAAEKIVEQHGGQMPKDAKTLRELPGVGPYTAGAIASIAFDLPEPAVDGNVVRVISRLFGLEGPEDPARKEEIAGLIRQVMPVGREGDFTQALMELGALQCLPGELQTCKACPLYSFCNAGRSGKTGQIPEKRRKIARPEKEMTVFLLESPEGIALRKRAGKGVLAGLWELPWTEGTLSPEEGARRLSLWGVETAGELTPLKPHTHVFTHLIWHLSGYRATVPAPPPKVDGWEWSRRSERALPTAFSAMLQDTDWKG